MRIAHLVPTPIPVTHDRGGAVQRRALSVARAQAAMGHHVVIFSAGDHGEVDLDGVTVHGITCMSQRPLRDYEYLLRVRSALRSSSFDVIHSHGVPDAARVLAGAARGSVFVLTVDYFRYRLTERRIGRRYYRNSLRRYRAICPVSDYCSRELLRFYGDDLAAQVEVVHNGVDTAQFFPDLDEAARVAGTYQLPTSSPYVVYLGRINRQKGSDLLPVLARQLAGVQVVAAGPIGQFGEDGDGMIVDDLLDAGGRYLGPVPEDDLRGLLSGAHALVLPTRHDEMFGMVLIEAGACGTPAVASDLGGIPEAVGDGGLLVPVDDTADLAEKTTRVVQDGSLRDHLSVAALTNARRFSWPHIAERYDHVYAR